MKKLANKLIKLTGHLCSVIRNSMPAYSCRKSKHLYKQHQLAVIWCLMKYLKTNYRGIIVMLELMPELMQIIGLYQLPHFTTVNKFFLRINVSVIYTVLVKSVYLFPDEPSIVAIDATGYSDSRASRHYLWRIGCGNYTMRKYIKLSISVCTDSQCIIAAKTRLGPRNDHIDFEYLARQSVSFAKPTHIVADKGYDSEANHHLVRQLGSHPMIPLRKSKYSAVNGYQRRKMLREFNEAIYNRRPMVETVNSVMKRLMGSWVQSRSLVIQCKEVVGMCAVYNVHRYIRISLFYGCFLHGQPNESFINLVKHKYRKEHNRLGAFSVNAI